MFIKVLLMIVFVGLFSLFYFTDFKPTSSLVSVLLIVCSGVTLIDFMLLNSIRIPKKIDKKLYNNLMERFSDYNIHFCFTIFYSFVVYLICTYFIEIKNKGMFSNIALILTFTLLIDSIIKNLIDYFKTIIFKNEINLFFRKFPVKGKVIML